MARAKKEAALTPEERLQAALVPDWEWPYKLPENWCWLKLVESFDNHTDSKKKIKQKDYLEKGKLAVVDQGQELIGGYTNDVEKSYSGALPIVIFGDHTRCIKFVDFPFAQGADGVKVLRPKPFYLPKAFYYALQSVNIPNLGYRRHFPLFNKFSIPLPPFAEQQRIVDRIESLFAKLDESKEKAQAVVDSFETRKAAILHKAFTGELTAKWREERGVRMESWEKKSVGELCISLKYGTAKKSDASGNVVVLRMGNLQQGEIDWSDLAYSNDPDDIEKYKLFPGDVLFNRTNSAALVGKTAIYRGEHPAIYAGYLIKLDYDHDKIIGDYLNYALNTLDAKKYCNSVKTDGVNQSNINAKKIGAYSFNVPSIPEQEKIVSVIQKLLSKEQQSKEAAEAVLDQIDLMKKSILARAFRGELGTNDPSEESAVELLKKVSHMPAETKSKTKRKFVPQKIEAQIKTDLERKIIMAFIQNDAVIMPIQQLMSVSSRKFDVIETLRNLQERGILLKENDTYKLMG